MKAEPETVLQGGRAKAYRPMPEAARHEAVEAGLAAYARGDFFLAHELLEPPWMGTRDLPERELIQGVIKLAAAFVHGARRNAAGVEKNLRGARDRVGNGVEAGPRLGIDAGALLASIDRWLANEHAGPPEVDEVIQIPRIAQRQAPEER